ncbi:alginate lyase family protein [Terrimonas alba]|uniref:alginate lyase family protein n=1 Tax=Terrimonas alba TaxID=3349636 RepID=UPI0035F3674E
MQKQFKGIIFFCVALFFVDTVISAQAFVHPGILHSNDDLQRMKKAVANKQEPIYSGYQLFIQNSASQYTYKMQGPLAMVGRNPTVGASAYDNDANAAHQNAVMWAITGDKRYADKAIEIVNAWSSTLKLITGKDAVLMAGLGPFKMINAAEILRYTSSGWKETDIRQTEKHFKKVIYPVLKDFAPFANGNWDAAAIKTMMGISVFCNDRSMFERALHYYAKGHGNGSLNHYIINEDGQVQESGRDQAHTQLGIGMLAECCAIAWNQGLDLYAYDNNRLLKGFEYTAKFNSGNDDVPFTEWLDRTGKYHHTQISQKARGELRAVYEQVYNHYVIQMGLTAPFVQQAAEKLRPEGPGKPGADHPGYGTLYFASKKKTFIDTRPVAPGAVIADGSGKEIKLKWIESVGATAYTIKRATKAGGSYSIIARNVKQSTYVDKQVKPGATYYYTITALNEKGESANSYETASAAGLPSAWKQKDIGNARGTTSFDGKIFTIESFGKNSDNTNDELHFTYQPISGNGEMIARFVPQPSSQFSQMGLMMREESENNPSFVSLMIYPAKKADIELPDWRVKMIARNVTAAKVDTSINALSLSEPAVTWGRLTGYVWLRLQRNGNNFICSLSYDGKKWQQLQTEVLPLNKNVFVGLFASSGMPNSTTVFFDHVLIQKSK